MYLVPVYNQWTSCIWLRIIVCHSIQNRPVSILRFEIIFTIELIPEMPELRVPNRTKYWFPLNIKMHKAHTHTYISLDVILFVFRFIEFNCQHIQARFCFERIETDGGFGENNRKCHETANESIHNTHNKNNILFQFSAGVAKNEFGYPMIPIPFTFFLFSI